MPRSNAKILTKTSPLLRSKGWDERVSARLLRAADSWDNSPEFRGHGHSLRRLFTDLKIDAVLCVEGRPSVCIKDARTLSAPDVEALRRQLWNLGATTLFIAECRNDIKVFSTLVKPVNDDLNGGSAQLPNESIDNLQAVELALRLSQLVHRIETGAIYLEHKSLFEPQSAVDQALLENLREVRNLICPERSWRGYEQAHALIGRFLFSCYLLDRHIIGPAYLKATNLPETHDVLELLRSSTNAPKTLTQLFKALQRDFNGSLFGDLLDDHEIGDAEVRYFQRFLSGENLKTGQLSLFKLYDFGFIPVEFISSIYEEFLGTEAEAEAAEGSQSTRDSHTDAQRSQGAYYTPPRLAELTVDIATEGWNTLLDKRCLDPACGSGVFLVILFIRMAEEWRKRNPTASTRRRYDALMGLLSHNLRGIDIHPTACLVTCFSLYLTFLDQMEPKEIVELRDVLERDTRAKLLPRILWEHDRPRPRPPHLTTVRGLDFFVLPIEKEFDLVIGNPPWVSRRAAPSAEGWLFSPKHNPYLEGVARAEPSMYFPARELACAFMWKAGLHLLSEGRVCQVLPSRVFLSNNTDSFQSVWLQHHRLETVWLLADWRFILFPTADCPCFVSRYHPRDKQEAFGMFEFITPKVELLDPRQALISVLPDDQKELSESDIISAANHKDAAAAWKKHHWGTPRDARLIERLSQLPRLKRLAKRPPSNPALVPADRKRVWFKGQGFQPASDSTTDPKEVFWKETDLFLAANAPVMELLLLEENCDPIGDLYKDEGLHRARSPLLYKEPLLLINKGCTKFLFSNFDVLFQDDFQSICAPKDEEDELLFLTAVLSSPLAQYLLFHTTANIGIERDIARLEEILELPFPLPEDMPDPKRGETILRSCAQRLKRLDTDLHMPEHLLSREHLVQEAQADLYGFVYDYFQICDWEQQLIDDTVEIFRPSSTPSSLEAETLFTARPSTREHRAAYADTLIQTFRGWSSTERHLSASTSVAEKPGLAYITFGISDEPREYSESSSEDQFFRVLSSIRKISSMNGALFSRLRGFVFYETDRVHILKPLNRRNWTRTAALNDADEILARMMEEDGWRD